MQKIGLANWKILLPVAVRVFAIAIIFVSLIAVESFTNIQSDNASATDLADASQIVFSPNQDDHSNSESISDFNCDHMSGCSSVAQIGKRPDILVVTGAIVLPEFVNTMVGRSIEPPHFPPKI